MFPNNEKRKNYFLAACSIWDQNDNFFPHRGFIGYSLFISGILPIEIESVRLHAISHISAGAVKTTTNSGPG